MPFLWTALGIIGFLALAILITAFVCHRMMYCSPAKRTLGEGEYAIPDGDIYEAFREDMIAWTDMIRAFPYKETVVSSLGNARFHAWERSFPFVETHGNSKCLILRCLM